MSLLSWSKTLTDTTSPLTFDVPKVVYELSADYGENTAYEIRITFLPHKILLASPDRAYYWSLTKVRKRAVYQNDQPIGDWAEVIHQTEEIPLNRQGPHDRIQQTVISEVIEAVEITLFTPMQHLDIRLNEAKT